MKFLYQIKINETYNGFSYCIYADKRISPSYTKYETINFYMNEEYIHTVHLFECEWIKQYDEAGELVQIVYEKEKKE